MKSRHWPWLYKVAADALYERLKVEEPNGDSVATRLGSAMDGCLPGWRDRVRQAEGALSDEALNTKLYQRIMYLRERKGGRHAWLSRFGDDHPLVAVHRQLRSGSTKHLHPLVADELTRRYG